MKILPLETVTLTAWAEENFLFGIVKSMDTGWDWLMNQFIQLRGAHYINYEYGAVDSSITFYPYAIHQLAPNIFDLCPYIDKYTLPKKFVKKHYSSFFDFVKEMIDDGFYLSTFLDQFFREDKSLDSDFRHPNFIYGYCDEENRVYIADNFENGKYGEKSISKEDLEKAFELVSDEIWEVSVFLYKMVEYSHKFNSQYVKEQIEDYLHPNRGICYFNRTICMEPKHVDEKYFNEVFFGVECYGLLKNYLAALINGDYRYMDNDWRSFSMLLDHKTVMQERYVYMVENGYIVENEKLSKGLEHLKRECTIIRNLFLKYVARGETIILFRIAERLQNVHTEDCEMMKLFQNNIIDHV